MTAFHEQPLFEYPSAFMPGEAGEPGNVVDFSQLQPLVAQRIIRAGQHPEAPLTIYNYDAIRSQRVSSEEGTPYERIIDACRGLIVNNETGLVVARPFERMTELKEHEALPEGPQTVTLKIDGSLGIQYSLPNGQPAIASRGSFSGKHAQYGNEMLAQYGQHAEFDPNITYLWEMVVPEGDYTIPHEPGMTLLGRIVTATGVELPLPDQSEVSYPVIQAQEGEAYATAASMRALDRSDIEGFVVKKEDTGERYKVKSLAYRWLTMDRNGEIPRYMRDKLLDGGTFSGMVGRVPRSIRPMMQGHADRLQADIDEALGPVMAVIRGESDVTTLSGREQQVYRTMILGGNREALTVLIKKPPRRQARSQRDAARRDEQTGATASLSDAKRSPWFRRLFRRPG